MRHAGSNRKFSRTAAHRRSLFRNMATSLLQHESFYTTLEKAKDLRKVVEPLITMAKNDSLHARRKAYSYLLNKKVVQKLFSDISQRFKNRPGGYLRVVRADRRHGDAAQMAYVQLVEKAKVREKNKDGDKTEKAKKPRTKKKAE
mgnify:CR=1 FL=1